MKSSNRYLHGAKSYSCRRNLEDGVIIDYLFSEEVFLCAKTKMIEMDR
jgi:hypothetical protein